MSNNDCTTNIINKINELKEKRNALIIAHNYQLSEVQDIADFVGDSLELSRKAADTDADVIVFCGVHFMAETAKILSPEKTVLIPDIKAGCPMADMINVAKLREFKAEYPGRTTAAYVNTSAEVKAEVDICCTSANALEIVESLDADEILFVPDQSLADYVAQRTTKKIIPFSGYCPTHHRISREQIVAQKEKHPGAVVLAHPECTRDVLELADGIFSTAGMISYVKESSAKEFIVATEQGILHRLQLDNPDKKFYSPTERTICPNMKKITLKKVLWSLEEMQYVIELDPEIIKRARNSIDRMIAIR